MPLNGAKADAKPIIARWVILMYNLIVFFVSRSYSFFYMSNLIVFLMMQSDSFFLHRMNVDVGNGLIPIQPPVYCHFEHIVGDIKLLVVNPR